ncbi:MAG: hypothetical protein PHV02_08390 [Rhodocyclaceae bacterium]|nr:hypothetical protein [Rhodocyclaceae bacterium]
MDPRSRLVMLVISALLAACSFGYQARGTLSDVAGELRGKGYPANRGGGAFVLSDSDGRLICDGKTSAATAFPNPGNCAGERGEGLARCSDGREVPLRWEAISCRSWKGSGIDAQGNRLEFRVERR